MKPPNEQSPSRRETGSPVEPNDSGVESVLPLSPTAQPSVHHPKQPPLSSVLTHQRAPTVVLTGVRTTFMETSTQMLPGHRRTIGVGMATVTMVTGKGEYEMFLSTNESSKLYIYPSKTTL